MRVQGVCACVGCGGMCWSAGTSKAAAVEMNAGGEWVRRERERVRCGSSHIIGINRVKVTSWTWSGAAIDAQSVNGVRVDEDRHGVVVIKVCRRGRGADVWLALWLQSTGHR